MNWFMIWLDVNAFIGTGICVVLGPERLLAIRQWFIDRLMRGVRGK